VNRGIDDAGFSDLPWVSVFDPAANARALNSIQAEGFRAASELVDRFVRIARGGLNGTDWPTISSAPLNNEQRADIFGATDVAPLLKSWWSVIGQMLLGAEAQDSSGPEEPVVDLEKVETAGRIELVTTAPGVATTEVWLHNRGTTDFGDVTVHCSELLAHDGNIIPSDSVRVLPQIVAMPPRSSRGIAVEVSVGVDVAPGTYRGNLLASGGSGLWLPVILAVEAAPS
jgi:hypothetical protein